MSLGRKDSGIALITSLLLSLIAIVLVAAIMTLVVTSTKHSGAIKRYTSSLEASKGGIEDFISVLKRDSWNYSSSTNWISGHTCKLRRDTSLWSDVCNVCSDMSKCTSNANPSDIIEYADWKKDYGYYTVYAKIIDCKSYSDGFIYNIEVIGIGNRTSEKSWIEVLYQLIP